MAIEKIKIVNLSKTFFGNKGYSIQALNDVNLDIYEKEFLSIVGQSGCGKSTLLHISAGLIQPSEGAVYYNGKKIYKPNQEIGIVFQEDAVFPWYTVKENIEYGPQQRKLSRSKIKETTEKYLKIVGLEKFKNSWPKELSGGMKKRVDLARAIANEPDVLLMDEPFGALDVFTKENLQVEIDGLFNKVRKTIFFVTHDLEEAIFLSDRIAVMTKRPGCIKEIVKVNFKRPRLPIIKMSVEFQELRKKLNTFVCEGI